MTETLVGRPDWHGDLQPTDWLLDGSPVTKARLEFFSGLDWSNARIDMGPSVAGNPGPYWHVPHPEHDTSHRLYPKFLQSKWLPVIQHACREVSARSEARALAAESSLSEAVKAEREACAQTAEEEDVLTHDPFSHASAIASTIRSRAAVLDSEKM